MLIHTPPTGVGMITVKLLRHGLLICLFMLPCIGISDEAKPEHTDKDRSLVRFEWSNDILTGNDNGFTAAWGLIMAFTREGQLDRCFKTVPMDRPYHSWTGNDS